MSHTASQTVELPTVIDPRGKLTFVEGGVHVPFPIRRVYWISDVPSGAVRGAAAYRNLELLVIALSGSFDAVLDDGRSTEVIRLDRAFHGLYLPPMTWHQFENFSTNGVCLVLASQPYAEADYILDRAEFRALKGES
jgi:hypothetical protein